jgi:hypothetical protein
MTTERETAASWASTPPPDSLRREAESTVTRHSDTSRPQDRVDIALAAVGFAIDCREIVRRISALTEGGAP